MVAALSLSACSNDWLDVNPSTSVPAETAINTLQDLTNSRLGMYAAVRGDGSNYVDYLGSKMFLYGEVHGEDMQSNALGSDRGTFYYLMSYTTAGEFNGNAIWQSPYLVMSRANRLISVIDEADKDYKKSATALQYKNEALVLRAMATFDLCRVYGKPYTEDQGASLGVPLDTTLIDVYAKPARNTVKECYDQVLKDLNTAINSGCLDSARTQGYVNIWAAKALLTRVYLTMGDFEKTLETAEEIIAQSPYTLWTVDEYANAWNKNSLAHTNEMMFELVINNDNSEWTDREGIAYLYYENTGDKDGKPASGYGDVVATKKFVDMLESDPKDVRNDVFTAAVNDDEHIYDGHKVYLNKFPPINGDVRYENVPVLRLSEVYLSAAEAAMNLGDTEKAAKYLNAIISNRTTDESKVVTASDISMDRIYIERRKELVGEGQRYFDALRRNETIVRYTDDKDQGWHGELLPANRSYNRDYFKAISAIPAYEMNANPNMKQNPGYAE